MANDLSDCSAAFDRVGKRVARRKREEGRVGTQEGRERRRGGGEGKCGGNVRKETPVELEEIKHFGGGGGA